MGEEGFVKDVAVIRQSPGDASMERPSLVLVHGGCHGAWCWDAMQEEWSALGWPSVALDWYSHGRSRTLEEPAWLARDVLAVQEEISLVVDAVANETGRDPVLVGHSMGGLASLAFAASNQQTLAALVLLAPVPPSGRARQIDMPVDLNAHWGPPPPDLARQFFYSGVDDVRAAALYPRLQPESPAAVWQSTRMTADVDLKLVECPALLFAAQEDALVSPEAVEAVAVELAADFVLIPHAGHGLTLDPCSEEICRQIDRWLTTGNLPDV